MPPKRTRNPALTHSNSFVCNCERICRGELTPLPRSTFYKHKNYRTKAPNFSGPQSDETMASRHGKKKASNVSDSDFEPRLNTVKPSAESGPSRSPPDNEIIDNDLMSANGLMCAGHILNVNAHLSREEDLATYDSETEKNHVDFEYEQMQNRTSNSPDLGPSDEPDESTMTLGFDSQLGNEEMTLGSISFQETEQKLLQIHPQIPDLESTMKFIRALRSSNLNASGLTSNQIENLRNPGPPSPFDEDTADLFSLQQLLATSNAPEKVYRAVSTNYNLRHPEVPMLSLDDARKALAERSGVYGISMNMCINSCMAFSGPFKDLEKCRFCDSHQYHVQVGNKPRKPLRQFYSIPIGPQIQALWKNPSTAAKMCYRQTRTTQIINELHNTNGETSRYDDILNGTEYLEAVNRGDIGPKDTVLMFAMDGAQLYPDKQSDTWIFIFTLLELSPEFRFLKKHVMVASCVPGPQKPQHFDSFLFPTFQHIAAINNEGGLLIWDAITKSTFISKLFCFLNTADGPGSIYFTGLVGHHGAFPCRLFCGIKGRHKPRIPIYYPVLLKPTNYNIAECSHGDVNSKEHISTAAENYYQHLGFLLNATSSTNYKKRRKLTGLSKPPLILGLNLQTRLPLFAGLSGDAMHVTTLNLGELFPPLWRGTFPRDGTDSIHDWDWAVFRDASLWQDHGKRIADCKQHIPSSFDHPPRNLAEKINSGYKAKEWQNYFLGLAPALLFHILPTKYWRNFCKLIRAIQICMQYSITQADLFCAQELLDDFAMEFENLYIRRRVDRLHFARPCIHAIWHLGLEIARLGPSCLYAAWTMERTIGNLGEEIRSDSRPYANLMERCLLRCQINTIKILYPELDSDFDSTLQRSISIGSGYSLLRARERNAHVLDPLYSEIVKDHLLSEGFQIPENFVWKFQRWARLSLPNGQIARSAWKELARKNQNVRCSRNVKFCMNGITRFGEVEFYLHIPTAEKDYGFALIHLYSSHDIPLYQNSSGTIICVRKLTQENSTYMINATSIESVVSAQPWPEYGIDYFFVWERSGIALSSLENILDCQDDD